jgi:probable phosphoglycerate mutase
MKKLLFIAGLIATLTGLPTYSKKTIINLVNSGQTEWDKEGQKKYLTYTDIPLNDMGIKQAEDLAKKFCDVEFTRIFSSDLTRATTTAKIIRGSNPTKIIESPLLQPRTLGKGTDHDWEGKSTDELKKYMKSNNISLNDMSPEEYLNFTLHGQFKESFNDEFKRASNYLAEISKNNDHGEHILVVSHTSVIMNPRNWTREIGEKGVV